jgi:hypothetical protein
MPLTLYTGGTVSVKNTPGIHVSHGHQLPRDTCYNNTRTLSPLAQDDVRAKLQHQDCSNTVLEYASTLTESINSLRFGGIIN